MAGHIYERLIRWLFTNGPSSQSKYEVTFTFILFALAILNIAITRSRLANNPLLSAAAQIFNRTALTVVYSPILIPTSLAILASQRASFIYTHRIWLALRTPSAALAWLLESLLRIGTHGTDPQRNTLDGMGRNMDTTLIPPEHILLAWRIQTSVRGPGRVTGSIIEITSSGCDDYTLDPDWTTPPIAESTPLPTQICLCEKASSSERQAGKVENLEPLVKVPCTGSATLTDWMSHLVISQGVCTTASPKQTAGSTLISVPSEEILYLGHIRRDNSTVMTAPSDDALSRDSLENEKAGILADALLQALETTTTSSVIRCEQDTLLSSNLSPGNTGGDSNGDTTPSFTRDAGVGNRDGEQHAIHLTMGSKSKRWLQPDNRLHPVTRATSPQAKSPMLVATPQLLALHAESPTPIALHSDLDEFTLKPLVKALEAEAPAKLTRRAKKRLVKLKLRLEAEAIASLPDILADQPTGKPMFDDSIPRGVPLAVPITPLNVVASEILKERLAEPAVNLPFAQADAPLILDVTSAGGVPEGQAPAGLSRGARRRRLAKLRKEAEHDGNLSQIPAGEAGMGVTPIHQQPPPGYVQPPGLGFQRHLPVQPLSPAFYPSQPYNPGIRGRFPAPHVIYSPPQNVPLNRSHFGPQRNLPQLPSLQEDPGLLCDFHQNARRV